MRGAINVNKLKERRVNANLTQANVAKELAIDQTAVSQWETGACMPRLTNLFKLAKLYGCTVDELVKEEQAEE